MFVNSLGYIPFSISNLLTRIFPILNRDVNYEFSFLQNFSFLIVTKWKNFQRRYHRDYAILSNYDYYFKVKKFRAHKISRISRMTPPFAKLNRREKNL